MSPGLNALFLELPNLHRGNPPARLPDQVSPGAEPGKAFALADANEQEMEVKESEEGTLRATIADLSQQCDH